MWKIGSYHTSINLEQKGHPMREDTTEALAGAIRVDGQQLTGHIDEAVRSRVEERLNGLLEADAICGAERSADEIDARAGRYGRDFPKFCPRFA